MSNNSNPWEDIDRTNKPETYAEYLDTVTVTSEVQGHKLKTYKLLNPRPGTRFLDVGCGLGDDVRGLAKFVGSDGLVVGIDRSSSFIETAKQRSEGLSLPVEFRVEDVHQLSFADNIFDGCRADRVFTTCQTDAKLCPR